MSDDTLPSPTTLDIAAARDLRERFGWSRQRMAQELRVHENTIVRWESGAGKPTGRRLDDWVDLLDRISRQLAQIA